MKTDSLVTIFKADARMMATRAVSPALHNESFAAHLGMFGAIARVLAQIPDNDISLMPIEKAISALLPTAMGAHMRNELPKLQAAVDATIRRQRTEFIAGIVQHSDTDATSLRVDFSAVPEIKLGGKTAGEWVAERMGEMNSVLFNVTVDAAARADKNLELFIKVTDLNLRQWQDKVFQMLDFTVRSFANEWIRLIKVAITNG